MQIIRSYIFLVFSVVCFLAGSTSVWAQTPCDNWSIQTQIDSATCKANGKIAITLAGADKVNLGSLLYSLTPISGGTTKVVQSATAVLENIEPGTYDLLVEAVCYGTPVSKSTQVRVPGKYENVKLFLKPNKATFGKCAVGGIECHITKGNAPYTISVLDAPASYTGTRTFTTNDSVFQIDNLNEGAFKVAVEDGCNTRELDSTKVVKEALPINGNVSIVKDQYNCRVYVKGFCDLYERTDARSHYSYAYSFNGGPIGSYKPIGVLNDTVDVLVGTTLKDINNRDVRIHIKSDCGDTLSMVRTAYGAQLSNDFKLKCSGKFDVYYRISGANVICFPVYVKLTNNTKNLVYYDTVLTAATGTVSRTVSEVEEGEYSVAATTADGLVINSGFYARNVGPLYSIMLDPTTSQDGNDGKTGFVIVRNGTWMRNSTVELIGGPPNIRYYYNLGSFAPSSHFYFEQTTEASPQYFPTGSYLFRVTDSCGVYDLPIVVTEQDVYRYHWGYTVQQTCNGLKVTPTGDYTYKGKTASAFYKIFSGPDGEGTLVRSGESLLLRLPGKYTIGTGPYAYFRDFKVNVKTIQYNAPDELNIDRRNSLGWVCPGAAPNTGSIRVLAVGGKSGSRIYTYKLAEQGNGANGPYLDSNSTGSFTSNARYSLMKNLSYSIRVIDACGNSIVQDIQILDFATYQIITTDKPMFCVGDTVYLRAINLPTTAKSYHWDFPNGQSKDGVQNPILYNIDSSWAGKYKVTISSDLCGQPIKGEVDIKVAPYTIRCYSAVTDTSVNPYIHGLLGNWRPSKNYVYYGARAQADPAVKTDIRKDGAYADFMSFWEKQTSSWTPHQDTTRWVWNAESTVFSKKGLELENKDPLGRYNAGLYGYDGAVPVAVVQNSRYRESGFDGFEDYDFVAGKCDDGFCPVGRHFDFSRYKNKLSGKQSHTGRFSLKAAKGDSIMLSALVTDSDRLLTAPDFQQAIKCNTNVLKAVRLNPGVLVPEFSPVAGKRFLFSVWVKEEQDCKCTSYSSSEITLLVGGPVRVTATAKPKGAIIDGWQQYEGVIDVPTGSTAFNVVIVPQNNVNVYYDDLRVHPYNANMKSFVYDPVNLRLMAELDENNYATFYEYDDDGTLTRVKKETERGVKTIKETRSALLKETAQ
ncbi:hypothetical protein [Chitinophaga varians]|uniref:hypothetical protein n=1 Tax=Chitinophaga varians TaxID=2202339 RepID=UPI00165F2531|nr:hypothetical protein [Chitinophaga varians]MBC9913356.1 hypothetical protein [Chitinophaga varians]